MLTTCENYDEAKAFSLTPPKKAHRIKQLLAQATRLGLQLTQREDVIFGRADPRAGSMGESIEAGFRARDGAALES